MQYLLLLVVILVTSSQNIFMKQYSVKSSKQNQILFSAISALVAMVFFVISSGIRMNFKWEFVPYSVGFAIAYAAALMGVNLSIASGPLSVSSLVTSYSLIIPTLYGIIFLKDSLKGTAYIGIALLLISLYFINMKKEAAKFSIKWLIYLGIGFVGNGMCSTIQKMQQLKFDGAYKNEFMVVALGIAAVFLMVIVFMRKGDVKAELRECRIYAPLNGIANGATNLLVMILTGLIPTALLFPSISAGGIAIMFFISIFVYKEKLSKMQMIGYGIGMLSVILLNI